jgi:hypothetical protein
MSRRLALALVTAAAAGVVVPTQASAATPRVTCWNSEADGSTSRSTAVRPTGVCGILPKRQRGTGYGDYGNGLLRMRWSSWSSTAKGRGASLRLWGDIRVTLAKPRRVCGTYQYTRATVVYVGGGPSWPTKRFALKTC